MRMHPAAAPRYEMLLDPATLTLVAAGAAIAGSAVSAVGAIQQGRAAKKQADYQASIQQQQAERERLNAASKEEDFRRQQSRLMATRRAMLGGAGVEAGTGSPLLVSEDFAGESELQALRIRNGGEVTATRLEQSAMLQRMAGANAQQEGLFRAGASLLSGAGKAAGMFGGGGGGGTDPSFAGVGSGAFPY